MDIIYTIKNDEYYTLAEPEPNVVVRVPFELDSVGWKSKVCFNELDDLLFDWLDSWDGYVKFDELLPRLKEHGYDTNLENYICVKCPYLPFRHYYHRIEKWLL